MLKLSPAHMDILGRIHGSIFDRTSAPPTVQTPSSSLFARLSTTRPQSLLDHNKDTHQATHKAESQYLFSPGVQRPVRGNPLIRIICVSNESLEVTQP